MEEKVKAYLEKLYDCLASFSDDTKRRVKKQLSIFKDSKEQPIELDGRGEVLGKQLVIAVECDDSIEIKEEGYTPYACHEEDYLVVVVTSDDIKLFIYQHEVWRSLMPGSNKTVYKNRRSWEEELSDNLFYSGNWLVLY